MKKSLLLMPLVMAFLCGCKESSSIQTYQPPINVETSVINEESAVKKTTKASSKTSTKSTKNATTTTTTAPKTNTSTIKDLIIDGNGNLVATKSNNTFAIIGNVQGQKGAKGDTGERGAQGEKGQDGRGIASCNVDSNGDLIITYTDGATQNAGNVRQEVSAHDYEQVGYSVSVGDTMPFSSSTYIEIGQTYINESRITENVHSLSVVLIGVNDSMPSKKYNYSISGTYGFSDFSLKEVGSYYLEGNLGIVFDTDTEPQVYLPPCTTFHSIDEILSKPFNMTFSSPIPITRVERIGINGYPELYKYD